MDDGASTPTTSSGIERRFEVTAVEQRRAAISKRYLDAAPQLTSEPEVKTRAGYFAEFDAFCRCYPGREERLSAILAEAVRDPAETESRSLRILDVGSADGRLLRTLLTRLTAASVSITCLEPCPEGFRRLQESALALALRVELHQQTLEAWLPSDASVFEPFDLVICSHVHYHFDDPAEVTRRLAHFISRSGALVAIIDSHDSPLYQWLDTDPVRSNSAHTSRYGGYFGFEHLRAALEERDLPHTFGLIDSSLNFSAASDFNHTVAFLGRRTVIDGATEEHRPPWADTFPCQVNWREGFVVLRGSQLLEA